MTVVFMFKSLTDKQAFNMFSQGKIELNSHGIQIKARIDNAKVTHRRNDQKNKKEFFQKLNETRG